MAKKKKHKNKNFVKLAGGALDGIETTVVDDSVAVTVGYAVQEGKVFLRPSDEGFDPSKPFRTFAAIYKRNFDGIFCFSYNAPAKTRWSFVVCD